MKLALLSDIHSNLHALEACLDHARAQGAQRFAFLGDLVGYGAHPGAVVDRIMLLTEEGALVLKGNHDQGAVHPPVTPQNLGDSSAAWTHAQLSSAQRTWLDQLPLTAQVGSALLVHASVNEPAMWRYVSDTRSATASLDAAQQFNAVRYVFGGHVHAQTLYYRGSESALMPFTPQSGVAIPVPKHRQWLATVGSVGQPRDGNPQAMYTLFDPDRAQLTFNRVRYDNAGAAAAIRATALPEYFAQRLEMGR